MDGSTFIDNRHQRMFQDARAVLVRNALSCRTAASKQRAAGNLETAVWYEERGAEFARIASEATP